MENHHVSWEKHNFSWENPPTSYFKQLFHENLRAGMTCDSRRRRHGADAAAMAPGLTTEGARGASDGGIIDFIVIQ